MILRASIAFLALLAVAVSAPSGIAAAADAQASTKTEQAKIAKAKQVKLQQAKAQQSKALRAKKAKEQRLAKAQQAKKEKKWYEDDRDRGLDIASDYAPKTIAKIRKGNTLAKGDTVRTGNGKRGWQQYVDRYYSR